MFKVTTPAAPLFLSLLIISLNSGVTGFVGNVSPGTAAHPVTRIVYASPSQFSTISGLILSGYSGLEANITYDNSFNVVDLLVGATIPPGF